MVLRDTIIFSQIREMFSYLTFDAVVVTCGTCREALGGMEAAPISSGRPSRTWRASRSTADCSACGSRPSAPRCLGTATPERPRRSPRATSTTLRVTTRSTGPPRPCCERAPGVQVETVPHCCSEAGTLALSRPDITDAMLHRKRAALREVLAGRSGRRGAVLLTNCPSCLHGLGRNAGIGAGPRHLAVELARALSGEGWRESFLAHAARAQAIHF